MGCTGRVTQAPVGPGFHQRGFTLVEIIVVIILLGILSAVAIPRFSDTSTFESASLRSSLLGSLKLAQKTALAQHASSVYWVLSRPAETRWQLQLLIDADSSDGNPPTDITPSQLNTQISAPATLNFNVSLVAGGSVTGTIGTSDNLVILFNQLGDMVRVKSNVVLASEASFPGSAQQVDSSLQFSDGSGDFCLSLTGYSYASTCR